MKKLLCLMVGALLSSLNLAASSAAQQLTIRDNNGDGIVSYLAFGDSLTAGVGDGIQPGVVVVDLDGTAHYAGGGYPARVAALSGLNVINKGVPGENLVSAGVDRLPSVAQTTSADMLGMMEGSNDAFTKMQSADYHRWMQRLVNVSVALGKQAALLTIPPPCCNHAGLNPFVRAYNSEIRNLALANDLPLADLERAWRTTCENQAACELFNLPEGEHPNERGYDVIGQTVVAALFGIDIFAPEGAKQLEDALGLTPGTIIVKPDVQSRMEY